MSDTRYDSDDLAKKDVFPLGFKISSRVCQNCYNKMTTRRNIVKIIPLGIIIVIVGSIGMAIAWNAVLFELYYPDEYAKQMEEIEQRKVIETQQRIEERKQEAELKRQEELKQQETLRIAQMKQLPASCKGVDSTETYLYPTADKCVEEIGQRFYDWCLSEERKVAEKGAEARANLCLTDIAIRLAQLCEDPVIGSSELCMMNSMQDLYRKLIPE